MRTRGERRNLTMKKWIHRIKEDFYTGYRTYNLVKSSKNLAKKANALSTYSFSAPVGNRGLGTGDYYIAKNWDDLFLGKFSHIRKNTSTPYSRKRGYDEYKRKEKLNLRQDLRKKVIDYYEEAEC